MCARKIAILLTLIAFLVSKASAQQPVFVAGEEDGQGFLRQRNNDCYLVTPQHVLGQAREATLVGDRAERHQAMLERIYQPDLAILRVPGLTGCPARFPDGGALDRLLQSTSEARLVSRSSSGAVRQLGVEIIASDERHLIVRAQNGERLFRGMSGSQLLIGGSAAGMLQSVDADSGTGTVLRQDYMSRLLESWFPDTIVRSRPYITNEVRPAVPTDDVDGPIADPASEPTRTRPSTSGGVQPASPLPEDEPAPSQESGHAEVERQAAAEPPLSESAQREAEAEAQAYAAQHAAEEAARAEAEREAAAAASESNAAKQPPCLESEVESDFPWPPPKFSAQVKIPRPLIRAAYEQAELSLLDLANLLQSSLVEIGYRDYSIYRIGCDGFALITRLERTDEEARPVSGTKRFAPPDAQEPFSLTLFLSRLFYAPPGRYRQIIFVATPRNIHSTGKSPSADDLSTLVDNGAAVLPRTFSAVPLSHYHTFAALIYEFEKGHDDGDVALLSPSEVGGIVHLEAMGIYDQLSNR